MTSGHVIAGGKNQGQQANQLNEPKNVIVSKQNHCLFISDFGNRRVMRWPYSNGSNEQSVFISDIDCYGLAMDIDGRLYMSDTMKHEVRRFEMEDTQGTLVAGGNGEGTRLDQLSRPSYLFVDEEYSVYVSDSKNHRVMKWMKGAKQGIVVAGGQGEENSLAQLSIPRGIEVDQLSNIYVVDDDNHRVMCWPEGAREGTVIVGGNKIENQLNGPTDMSFDQQSNLYVLDYGNDRVQKFHKISSSNIE